ALLIVVHLVLIVGLRPIVAKPVESVHGIGDALGVLAGTAEKLTPQGAVHAARGDRRGWRYTHLVHGGDAQAMGNMVQRVLILVIAQKHMGVGIGQERLRPLLAVQLLELAEPLQEWP